MTVFQDEKVRQEADLYWSLMGLALRSGLRVGAVEAGRLIATASGLIKMEDTEDGGMILRSVSFPRRKKVLGPARAAAIRDGIDSMLS